MLSPSTRSANVDRPPASPAASRSDEVDLVVVGDLLDRVARGDLPDQREAERAVLVGDRDAPSAIDKERALFGSRTSAPFLMSASTCSNTVTLLTPISSASSCIVGE
jgi:hypothetical protein